MSLIMAYLVKTSENIKGEEIEVLILLSALFWNYLWLL